MADANTPLLEPEEFVRHFAARGTEEVVGGNTPFLLDEETTVWLVESGKVEVFAVGVEDAEPVGSRVHYLTAEPGDALFGMDLETVGMGLGFLAVGVVGTKLIRLDLSELESAARLPAFAGSVVRLVDTWVRGLSHGVSKTIVPKPRAELTLSTGEDGKLGDGERARARKEVVWLGHQDGASLFVGMEEVGHDAAALFPVTQDSFVQALGDIQLKAVGTGQALRDPAGWEGLKTLHAAVFGCEFFNSGLAKADELNRLQEKAVKDRRVVGHALASLAAILDRGRARTLLGDGDDATLVAATLIGDYLGLTIKAPAKLKDGSEHADPVAAIVLASRIRSRKVVLKGDWWLTETTPLLAFMAEDRRAVAILPRHGKAELHDPLDGTVRELTPDLAAQIEPYAHTFYRSFPDGPMTAWQIFRFGLKNNGRDLFRPFVVAMFVGLLGMLPPHFTGKLIQTVIPEAERGRLVELGAVLAVIGVTTVLLGIVRRLSVLRLEIKMSASVQPAMWDRLIGLPVAFFRRFTAGDLTLRVSAIDQIRQVLSSATMTTLMLSVFSFFYVAQLLYYSWQLAVVGVFFALVTLVVASVASLMKLRIQREVMQTEGKISGLVLQLLTGIPKLRVAGAEGRALAEWARRFSLQKRLALRTGTVDAFVGVFTSGLSILATMAVFYTMVWLTRRAMEQGTIPLAIGDFVAFNAAFGILLGQMMELGTVGLSMLSVVPLFERAEPILNERKEVDDTKSDIEELNGDVEVSHVSFRYQEDGPLILDDVSVEIPTGKYVAFVGPSGSGKSTLLRLMLGLESPDSGAIYYDGRDLSQLDVQQLRRKIGVVIQNGRIRQGSIFENIVGAQPYTLNDAWEAARMAGLDRDIREMPMSMHTIIQQGGGSLSGGQRQRLMIARAVVSKPRILFFDEATSALDNRTQAIVSESLQELQATRVSIAHRLSTIIGADRIFVLVGGKVVQAGTYDELVSQDGVFSELVKRQVA